MCSKLMSNWKLSVEQAVFTDCRIRYNGSYDSNPRRHTVLPVNECNAEYGDVLLPAVRFNIRELSCEGFVRLVGKLLKILELVGEIF